MKGLSMDILAISVLMAVAVATAVGFIHGLFGDRSQEPRIPVPDANVSCETDGGIDERTLDRQIYLRSKERCETVSQTAEMEFTLTDKKFRQSMKDFRISDKDGEPLAVYRKSCEGVGEEFGGVVVGSSREKVLFRKGTELEITSQGNGVKICRG